MRGEVARQQLFLAGLAVKLLLLVGAGLATRLCLFGSSTPLPEGEPYEGPSPGPSVFGQARGFKDSRWFVVLCSVMALRELRQLKF